MMLIPRTRALVAIKWDFCARERKEKKSSRNVHQSISSPSASQFNESWLPRVRGRTKEGENPDRKEEEKRDLARLHGCWRIRNAAGSKKPKQSCEQFQLLSRRRGGWDGGGKTASSC